MDSDRILVKIQLICTSYTHRAVSFMQVLNRGRIKEFDSPHLLLRNRNSLFRKMVKQTGTAAAQKLQRMAYDAYKETTSRCASVATGQQLQSIEETD